MKVFKSLAQKLSSDKPDEYIDAALKLAKWLGSDKAYYLEAREHIVAMLEAASQPLVRRLRLGSSQEFHISMCTVDIQEQAKAYKDLVDVVKPHLQRFPEDDLKSRLVNTFSTTHISLSSKPAPVTSSSPSAVHPDVQTATQRSSATQLTASGSTYQAHSNAKSATPTGSPRQGGSKHPNDTNTTVPKPSPGEQLRRPSSSQISKDEGKVAPMKPMPSGPPTSPLRPHTSTGMACPLDASPVAPQPAEPGPSQPVPTQSPARAKDEGKMVSMKPMPVGPLTSPLRPRTSTSMARPLDASLMAPQTAEPGPSRPVSSQNPARVHAVSVEPQPISHPTAVPVPATPTKPLDPKAPLPSPGIKRSSYPSKFMQLAAIDLKSYKRVQSQPKANDGKSVSFPQASTFSEPPSTSKSLQDGLDKQAGAESGRIVEQEKAAVSIIPTKDVPEGNDREKVAPYSKNSPELQDPIQKSVEPRSAPSTTVNLVNGVSSSHTEADGLSHPKSPERQSGAESTHKREQQKPEMKTIPSVSLEEVTTAKDREKVEDATPRSKNPPAPRDSPTKPPRASSPAVDNVVEDSRPQTYASGLSPPDVTVGPRAASNIRDQPASNFSDGASLQILATSRAESGAPKVGRSPNQLPIRHDQQDMSATVSTSPEQGGASRDVAMLPQSPQAPTARANQDDVPLPDREPDPATGPPETAPVNPVVSAPGAHPQTESSPDKDSRNSTARPSDSSHEVLHQQLCVDAQSTHTDATSSTPEDGNIGASSDDMQISVFTPLAFPPPLRDTAQNADTNHLTSSASQPPVSSIPASPAKETLEVPLKAQDNVPTRNISDLGTEQAIPKPDLPAPSEATSVLQLSGPTPTSAPPVSVQKDVVVGKVARTTEPEPNKVVSNVPLGATPLQSDAPPQPDNLISVQATSENTSHREDVSDAVVMSSNNDRHAKSLTALVRHFLQVHIDGDQQQHISQAVRNLEKVISDFPKEKVDEVVNAAKESRTVSLAVPNGQGVEDTASVIPPHGGKKRRRSLSIDQTTASERPSSRLRTGDNTFTIVEIGSEDASASDLTATARTRQPLSIMSQQSEDVASTDSSNSAPNIDSIPASGTSIRGAGVTEKENTPQGTEATIQRQYPSPSAVDSRRVENVLKRDFSQEVRDKRPNLGPLSYHPTPPFEIVQVIEGSSIHRIHELELELDDRQAAMVSRWNDRFNRYDRTAPCIAVTLICARVAEAEAWCERNPGANIQEATRNLQIQWPVDGGVWMTVQQDNAESIPLSISPPANLNSHEPLDLSPTIGPRTTKMRFIKTTDISGFVFVIRAHRPTEAQLHELEEAKRKNSAWRDALSSFSVPFDRSFHADTFTMLKPAAPSS